MIATVEVYCEHGPIDGAVVIAEPADTLDGYPDSIAVLNGRYVPTQTWADTDDGQMPIYRWEAE